MVRYCYICNIKQIKNKDFCLHKFPKNPEICLKWKQFCGLREIDDVHGIYICSYHFRPEDFQSHTLPVLALPVKRHLLLPGAVPSIRLKKQQILKIAKLLLTKESPKVNKDDTVEEKPQFEVSRDNNNEYVKVNKDEVSRDNNNEYVESQVKVQVYSSDKTKPASVIGLQKNNSSLVNMLTNVSCPVNDLCSTPKRRKYAEPRYISEIMTPDVQTPDKARRIIKFVKNNDMKQKKRIKELQRINRNLIKRIKTLENMVSHLKEKQLISKHAGDSLMVMEKKKMLTQVIK